MPEPGMIGSLTGGGGKGKLRNAQIEVLSYWELDRLPSADAATWLDKTIVAGQEPVMRETGVGLEVKAALAARQEWLIGQGLATRAPEGTMSPKPGLWPWPIRRFVDPKPFRGARDLRPQRRGLGRAARRERRI